MKLIRLEKKKEISIKIKLILPAICIYILIFSFSPILIGCKDELKTPSEFRRENNFDFDWKFKKGDYPEAIKLDFDDESWENINLPHDWGIDGVFSKDNPSGKEGAFAEGGIGWYRKQFILPNEFEGKRTCIKFGGVYMNSEVWINGHFLGKRPFGYISFQYDMTPYLNFGEKNLLVVRVDNSKQPNSRWYSGAGIYRHVKLIHTDLLHLKKDALFITTPKVSPEMAVIHSKATVVNQQTKSVAFVVNKELLDPLGEQVAIYEENLSLGSGERTTLSQNIEVDNPLLWSPETPNLYQLKIKVVSKGETLDEIITNVGIRSIRFDADRGFFLNEKNIKIKGVCNHSDFGALGVALNDRVLERRMEILKQMGCNAIRTAHNPPSEVFLDFCDKMGFMVVDEAFDEWIESWPWTTQKKQGKIKYGYHLYFDEWAENDLISLIRRDRNHPSVILWSVGNEVPDQCYEEGTERLKYLIEVVKKEDTTRPVTCGITHIHLANKSGFAQQLDVVGYNGGGGSCFRYEEDHQIYPNRKFIGSEVPHTFQTRGVYRTMSWYRDQNPLGGIRYVPNLTDEEISFDSCRFYSSSYDNAMVRISARDSWKQTSDLPFMSGEFRWTGFDYLGESMMGWPAKFWNFGIIDMCGFPKDAYYFYQSQWVNDPMIHLLPHWNWEGREGTVIPVVAYSNCETVELFLNGISLGKQMMKGKTDLIWRVPYEPGELMAIGKMGEKIVAEKIIRTTGIPARLKVFTDRQIIRANGRDVAHIELNVVDKNSVLVPGANSPVTFNVEGPVEIFGIDNGDPLNKSDYKGNSVDAFKGKCLLILKSTQKRGNVTIRAFSSGLEMGVVNIKCK